MKILLALGGSVLLCASVVSGAGPIVSAHPAVWFPSVGSLGQLSMSEPAGLLLLGAGLTLLARPARRRHR